VIDDTGRQVLAGALKDAFSSVRVLGLPANVGFARALTAGVQEARHELLFSMNADVRVRQGFLDPLVACMAEDDVAAVVPRILLRGEEQSIESLTELRERNGVIELYQPALQGHPPAAGLRLTQVAFAVGGAFLFRRTEFLEHGFDPLFEPFYWEDIDWCWSAWRRGRRTLYQPASVVEHQHRGTIGRRVAPDFVRAMVERNRLLFAWKHLDSGQLMRRHLASLYRWTLDAYLEDRREDLIWIAFALEALGEVDAARRRLPAQGPGIEELLRITRPEA